MLKRIINFNKRDWRHVLWLIADLIKQLFMCKFSEVRECVFLILIHLKYDSKRL